MSSPSLDSEAVETRTEWSQPPTRHESLSPFRGFNVGTNFASPFLRRSALSGLIFHPLRRSLSPPDPWAAPLSTPILAHIFQPLAALQIRELAVVPIDKKKTVTPTDGNRV